MKHNDVLFLTTEYVFRATQVTYVSGCKNDILVIDPELDYATTSIHFYLLPTKFKNKLTDDK
jgi:hypothetical protein